MYFYDYENSFVIPYFTFIGNSGWDDYKYMQVIPFNKVFWEHNNVMLLTESQKENIKLLGKDITTYEYNSENDYGYGFLSGLINWDKDKQYAPDELTPFLRNRFFKISYVFWDKDDRLIFKEDNKEKVHEKYKITIQILLDIVELEDSILWKSYTIFDSFDSFFYEEFNENFFAWLNIYFDLCEIKRREMEEKIRENHKTVQEITEIYNETKKEIENMRKQYFFETELGLDIPSLKKYNKIVKEKLNIDNYEMFKGFYKPEEGKKKGD